MQKLIEGVRIGKIPLIQKDIRGSVYRWCSGLSGKEISIFQRNAGISFGNHYHKGDDPSRNPERFLLLKGAVSFWAYNGITKERAEIVLEEFTEVEIDRGILHGSKAKTDVVFIEYRLNPYDEQNPDAYASETYEDYLRGLKKNKK